ncbi:hypothetical protein BZA70DRAFT_284409 [Myxozyma melibiosi]|uniref:Uncharacterized protein n=1 Tax=Myxozyma melibiosi TaxID=54550 RepID=A0ABR1EZD5_9ASCO
MRKRVAAILEFIGRTQIDMATEQDERKRLYELSRKPIDGRTTAAAVVEVEVGQEEVDGVFGTQKVSLEMMDGLTRKLLKWEQEFGRHGDRL